MWGRPLPPPHYLAVHKQLSQASHGDQAARPSLQVLHRLSQPEGSLCGPGGPGGGYEVFGRPQGVLKFSPEGRLGFGNNSQPLPGHLSRELELMVVHNFLQLCTAWNGYRNVSG